MSLSAVLHAAKLGDHSVMGMMVTATGPGVKCSRQYALSVVRKRKFRLSLAKVDQYTVANVTLK